ncbi:hypothetical protein THASP1DRAFT_33248 [Thamnocephalis sphaerospora]|uniref:Uncharacterized protein n=1 Tax=Thamnocephalis sphaerospora TaxID=78915 RepID=A0A4P9XH36_9FUNG|nr:hypothetical protein THASP1DRAFT_33248 [Thamnocephalis sphaerospora]|eukprot:RKP04928.1 hypothetical protein THASP1DRAFT_33248 [Thamnocephalis sphaerospora]
MRFIPLPNTAVAFLAGLALAGSAVDAFSPSRSSSHAVPEAPPPGMAPPSSTAPALGTALSPRYNRIVPSMRSLLNEYTQDLVQIYPFAIIKPEGTIIVEEDEFRAENGYRIHELTMIGADNKPFRSAKISRSMATNLIAKIEIDHISQDGERRNAASVLASGSASAAGNHNFALMTSRGRVFVTVGEMGGATNAYLNMINDSTVLTLNNVEIWDRKSINTVVGPRITDA